MDLYIHFHDMVLHKHGDTLPVPCWYSLLVYMTLLPTHHNLVDFTSCVV